MIKMFVIAVVGLTAILLSWMIAIFVVQRRSQRGGFYREKKHEEEEIKKNMNFGPKSWPIIGSMVEILLNYDRMHDWLSDYLSKSKTIVVRLPFTTYTYTADPANVEHVLKTNFPNYPKGETYRSYMGILLGNGIFNVDGDTWRKQRKTASFEFASKNLRDLSTVVFRDYAIKLAAILFMHFDQKSTFDMQELLMRMTLDSICKVGFGIEIGTLSPDLPRNDFAEAFDDANAIVTLRFVDPLWRLKRFLRIGSEARLANTINVIDNFTYEVIRKRKAELASARSTSTTDHEKMKMKHDILSRFMELGEEDPNSGFGSENRLRDVVLNFVIAGRDTTATTLSWFIYMIIINPDVADKLYRELLAFQKSREGSNCCSPLTAFSEKIKQFASLLTYESLSELPYLHAAITETLRLYPPVPQDPKGVMKDDVLPDGTRVRAGWMVTYVAYSMGRMEYNWGPDAACFRPERWLAGADGASGAATFNTSPFKFTAFQGGPRVCLGKDSAYLQMKMTMAILCRFFTFRLVNGHRVRYRMMTVLSMAHGLKLHVATRP